MHRRSFIKNILLSISALFVAPKTLVSNDKPIQEISVDGDIFEMEIWVPPNYRPTKMLSDFIKPVKPMESYDGFLTIKHTNNP